MRVVAPLTSGSAVAALLLLPFAAGAQAPRQQRDATKAPTEGSSLTLVPATPPAGSRVAVTYRPSAALAGDSVVVLRAVFRAPRDWMRNQLTLHVVEAARLRRGRDGRFHGAFTFPAQSSLGRFAVGSLDSLRADGNRGRHWSLLAHGADGRPTAGALSSASWDEMLRNDWDRALPYVRRLTDDYPADPGSWFNRIAVERAVVGEGRFAPRLAAYRGRLARFDSVPTARGDGDRLGSLYWLAFQLDDRARAAHWRARLIAEAPLHPLAVQARMDDLAGALRDRQAARLDSLEAIWEAAGPAHSTLIGSGFNAARATRDSAALLRWVDRAVRSGVVEPADGATQLAGVPALIPEALRRLAASLDSLDGGLGARLRDVDATLADVRREAPAKRREILAAMATASLRRGDSTAALARYVQASETGWSPSTVSAARSLAHARGDVALERRMSALLAADPLATEATRDSIRAAEPRLASGSAWSAFIAEGEREMLRGVPPEPPSVDASSSLRLAAWGTDSTRPVSLARGRISVIAIWAVGCPYSRPQLPALARLEKVLARRGISLLVVTPDPASAELAAFVAGQSAAPPIHHDLENTAGRTFAAYGFPWFIVVDGEGRLQSKGHDIPTVAAEAIAVARR
ncbi:MAG: redoxin domain-containing protein [Lacisediminihabitans sp.]